MRILDGLDTRFQNLPRAERLKAERAAFEELMGTHRRDLMVFSRYARFLQVGSEGEWQDVRAKWVGQAKSHPEDVFALNLGALALIGRDTPEALRLLESALRQDPMFGAPRLTLASLYSGGKFEDTAKAGRMIAGYFKVCPDATDRQTLSLVGRLGSTELQHQVASRLRSRLAVEKDPVVLRSYADLWGMEFRLSPPAGHDSLRVRILKDLERLTSLTENVDAEFLATLRQGYKLAGAPVERLTAVEDRLFREFPANFTSLRARAERFRRDHPPIKPEASGEEWDRRAQDWVHAAMGWTKMAPHEEYAWLTAFTELSNLEIVSRERGVEVAEGYLRVAEDLHGPQGPVRVRVAEFYLEHGIETERALELLESARPMVAHSKDLLQLDTLSPKDVERYTEFITSEAQEVLQLQLRAYQRAGLKDRALALRGEVESAEPKQKDLKPDYWRNRALLAWIDGRHTDALAYFQSALRVRDSAPGKERGRVKDPLLDQARKLWLEMKGSEAAFAVWAEVWPKKEATAQGEWEHPTKDLPPFELSDLGGKTWKLRSLEGKTVFINLWATWCGPCKQELPQLQKFWERNKDRSDFVILTLNADEQLGLVAPFLKENGYTFPVLPAWTYMNQVLGDWAVPQNWVVDSQGKWQWQQIGYDDRETDWGKAMLAKIQSVAAR